MDAGGGHRDSQASPFPARGGSQLSHREVLTVAKMLRGPLLERAIGVVYRPDTERQSHYFQCNMLDQFDYVMHFDHTRALEPLERGADWIRGEFPDTYPTGE
jgi:hypothetical protein